MYGVMRDGARGAGGEQRLPRMPLLAVQMDDPDLLGLRARRPGRHRKSRERTSGDRGPEFHAQGAAPRAARRRGMEGIWSRGMQSA